MPASFGLIPPRMFSTMRNEQRLKRLASPRPVDPHAPTSLSTYWPAPRMGESPARPGIFHARPLVVVIPQMSPPAVTASTLVVPQNECSGMRPSRTMDRPASSAARWKARVRSRSSSRLRRMRSGSVSVRPRSMPRSRSSGSSQWLGSTRRRHSIHSARERSVFRSSSMVKPMSRANSFAPSPTIRWWSVSYATAWATLEGVRTPSIAATPPAHLRGPCMQHESSCTTP